MTEFKCPVSPLDTSLTEIPEIIVLSCDFDRDVASLALTCCRIHAVAQRLLYERQILETDYFFLFWAARKNRIETLQRLTSIRTADSTLHTNFNIYWVSKGGGKYLISPLPNCGRFWTPLHVAVQAGAVQVVQFLLSHGADVDAPSLCFSDEKFAVDEYTWWVGFKDRFSFEARGLAMLSPLVLSAMFRRPVIAELLLKHRASTEILRVRDMQPTGTGALHFAAAFGASSTVRILIEGGYVSVDKSDGAGYPPLLWAALHDSSDDTLQVFKEMGASLDYIVPGRDGHSLVATLMIRNNPTAATRLVDLGWLRTSMAVKNTISTLDAEPLAIS
ncbi:Fc.00g108280.m01.CDS01 [Cosmosporella sp. VM-42]